MVVVGTVIVAVVDLVDYSGSFSGHSQQHGSSRRRRGNDLLINHEHRHVRRESRQDLERSVTGSRPCYERHDGTRRGDNR